MSSASLFAVCTLIWGTTWFAITVQLPVLAPEYGVGLRFCMAGLLLLVFCRIRGLPLAFDRRAHLLMALQGLAGFFGSYLCVYLAEQVIVSGVVAVGYAAIPLVAMLVSRAIFGTPMSSRVALGGAVGVVGVAAIFWHEFSRLAASVSVVWGAGITLAGVMLSALSTASMMGYHRRGVAGWGPLAWAMLWGGGASMLAGWARGRPWGWSWSPAFLGSLAYLTAAGSALAFGAYNELIRRHGAAKAGMLGVATPVVALLVSSWLEGFAWSALSVAGVALAVAGNLIALWPRPAPVQPSSTQTGA